MTLENVKKYTIDDFESKNDEVWAALNQLSTEELQEIDNFWKDNDIANGIFEIIFNRAEKFVEDKILEAFPTEKDKEKLQLVMLYDRTSAVEFFRSILLK